MTTIAEATPDTSVDGTEKVPVDDGGSAKYCTTAQIKTYVLAVMGALTGLIKCNGSSTFSAAVSGTDYQAPPSEGAFENGDKTKLDGIEAGATADQTGAQIKVAYEAESDTNAFTDAYKAKLIAIEAEADKTDATNVNSAGATMNADTDVSGNSWVVDEDTMVSDLATKVPTQQSVKAYVDAEIADIIPSGADASLPTGANADFEPSVLVYNKTCSGSDGDDVIDLHDGTDLGRIVTVYLGTKSGSDNAVITPVTALSYSTITLDAANEIATLQWQGATVGWAILYTNGTVA